jgi:hypothetical protein
MAVTDWIKMGFPGSTINLLSIDIFFDRVVGFVQLAPRFSRNRPGNSGGLSLYGSPSELLDHPSGSSVNAVRLV